MTTIPKIKVSPEIWVSLYSELSNFILERSSLDSIWTEDENGDEVMTEDKQDEFIDIVDTVETIMRDSGLVKQEVQ
jgi:hypothetical protein